MKGIQAAEKYSNLTNEKQHLTEEICKFQQRISLLNNQLSQVDRELAAIHAEAPQLVKALKMNYENLKEEN